MTPEERASICSHCLTDTTRSCHNDCAYYERYKAYVEQKAIDDKECETLVGLAVKECHQVFIDKTCEFFNERLYPTVKVQKGEDIDVVDRWKLIEDFRKTMTEKTNPLFEQCLANVNPETRAEVRNNMENQVMEHTFKFTEGAYPDFECNSDMPAMLYDKLREVVRDFYKEG